MYEYSQVNINHHKQFQCKTIEPFCIVESKVDTFITVACFIGENENFIDLQLIENPINDLIALAITILTN